MLDGEMTVSSQDSGLVFTVRGTYTDESERTKLASLAPESFVCEARLGGLVDEFSGAGWWTCSAFWATIL